MSKRRIGANIDKTRRLEDKVRELEASLAAFGPKKFVKTSCPYSGECGVTECAVLVVKCSKGEERNCLECVDFLNDEKCDNWAWRNCTIMREADRLGANPWAKKHAKLSQVNIRQIRERVKVI